MKKIALILSLATISIFTFVSCEKEKHEKVTIEENLEKTIKVNESVTFTLPQNERSNDFQINVAAAHAYVSKLGQDLEGNAIYMYTPEKDYVGSDFVSVSTEEKKSSKSHHGSKKSHSKGGGGCQSGDKERVEYLVNMRINIEKENSSSIEALNASKSN